MTTTVRSALITEFGAPPALRERPPTIGKKGTVELRVIAASFNPVDRLITSGRWYSGNPELPYVPGREGVGYVVSSSPHGWNSGDLVYFRTQGIEQGSMAEQVHAHVSNLVAIPDGLTPETAAAVGFVGTTAALALGIRGAMRAGERVVVLGATGSVGRAGAQIAAELGAGAVVAVGRSAVGWDDPRCSYVATDELWREAADDADRRNLLREAILDAADGPVDLVIDTVWGLPAEAAAGALAQGGRMVNLGSSAGAEATFSSELLRGRSLDLRGHTNASIAPQVFGDYCQQVFALARDGRVVVPSETYSLADVGSAWNRVGLSPATKVVVDLRKEN
jgi:NADPH:quinone reductase-like Zn-dependent oxidoreductase